MYHSPRVRCMTFSVDQDSCQSCDTRHNSFIDWYSTLERNCDEFHPLIFKAQAGTICRHILTANVTDLTARTFQRVCDTGSYFRTEIADRSTIPYDSPWKIYLNLIIFLGTRWDSQEMSKCVYLFSKYTRNINVKLKAVLNFLCLQTFV